MRPRPTSPTGTEIGPPLSTACMPRTSPAVELMAMQRTTVSPMWSATSTVRSMPFALSSMRIALRIFGSLSGSTATSTVGPITCTTRPAFMLGSSQPTGTRPARRWGLLERLGATHDVQQFLGDHRLANPVALQHQRVDQLARILARRSHRDHACGVFGRQRVGERREQLGGLVTRQPLGKDRSGIWLEERASVE